MYNTAIRRFPASAGREHERLQAEGPISRARPAAQHAPEVNFDFNNTARRRPHGHGFDERTRGARFVLSRARCSSQLAALALDVPPAPTQWFTDKRNSSSSPTEADLLNREARTVRAEQRRAVHHLRLPFARRRVARRLHHTAARTAWKVGQKKYDNGMMLFVFVKEQKMRIEVGYGLEGTITDAFSSRVIREIHRARILAPANYGRGLRPRPTRSSTRFARAKQPVPPLAAPQRGAAKGNSSASFR